MTGLHRFAALAALSLAAAGTGAQELESGRFIVANAGVDDPNFERSVLLLVHHAEDGSIGVALNRPTWIAPAEAFPGIDSLAGYGGTLFFGGPVSPAQPLLAFERGAREPQNSRHVLGPIYVTADLTLLEDIDLAAEDAPRVKLFAGHVAWVPGQLEEEIADGIWRILPGQPEHVFTADPEGLWRSLPLSFDAISAGLR